MLEQSALEALRDGYWYLYPATMLIGSIAFVRGSCLLLGRSLLALAMGSLLMAMVVGMNGGQTLTWWQQIAIDVPVLITITAPPRHYWQAALGALVLAQIVLHAAWGVNPDLAREHWLGNILFGYGKCLIVLLWSGGKRVQTVLDSAARLADRLVLAARSRKLA